MCSSVPSTRTCPRRAMVTSTKVTSISRTTYPHPPRKPVGPLQKMALLGYRLGLSFPPISSAQPNVGRVLPGLQKGTLSVPPLRSTLLTAPSNRSAKTRLPHTHFFITLLLLTFVQWTANKGVETSVTSSQVPTRKPSEANDLAN